MAISFVGAAAGTNTATMPTHQTGDIILVWAFRDGSTTAPTLPAGYRTLSTGTGTTCSYRLGFRHAPTASETVGTWTNATSTIVQVYRGALPWVNIATNAATTGTLTYPALTLRQTTSWIVGFVGHVNVDTAAETPATGFTFRQGQVDATSEAAGFDTDGAPGSWSQVTTTPGGTNGAHIELVLELEADTLASADFSDDFNRANANLESSATSSSGGTWTHDGLIAGGVAIDTNQIKTTTTDASGTAYKTPDLGSADQFVQYTTKMASSSGAFAACRVADRSNFIGIRNDGTALEVYRRNSGSLTNLTTLSGAVASGNVLRLEASGNMWRAFVNGRMVDGFTIGGTALTGTNAGIIARTTATNPWGDDFSAGDLTIASGNSANAAQDLSITQTATASVVVNASAAQDLAVTQTATASAVNAISATAAQDLAITQTASASVVVNAAANQNIAIDQTATATNPSAAPAVARGGGEAGFRRHKREDDTRSALQRLVGRLRAVETATVAEAAVPQALVKKVVSEARKATAVARAEQPAKAARLEQAVAELSAARAETARTTAALQAAVKAAEEIQRAIDEEDEALMLLLVA